MIDLTGEIIFTPKGSWFRHLFKSDKWVKYSYEGIEYTVRGSRPDGGPNE